MDKKLLAIELYKEGKPLKEICEITGLDRSYISKAAHAAGCEPRLKRGQNTTPSKNKCPHCKKMYPKGSNFCNHCGTDVRSKEQMLLPNIEWLRGHLYLLHDAIVVEKADKITRDVIDYLKSKL